MDELQGLSTTRFAMRFGRFSWFYRFREQVGWMDGCQDTIAG